MKLLLLNNILIDQYHNFSIISIGSKIFPNDFDIFFSSDNIQPCPKILLGNGNFAANKKAGQ